MEVLREAHLFRTFPSWLWRFNPCFNGSVERGVVVDAFRRFHESVSILVLMEVLREEPRRRVNGSVGPVSILVLMEVLREVMHRDMWSNGADVVSILVLMEVLREVDMESSFAVPSSRFQSLF